MKYQKYAKVITSNNMFALCAIYEPHPFRSSAISEAVNSNVDTGISDDEWTWVFYDAAGNPVGMSDTQPEGREVEKFVTADFEWLGTENSIRLCEYLNKTPFFSKST